MFASKQACYLFVLQVVGLQLLMALPSSSQKLDAVTVHLAAKDQTLAQIFNQIEAQTDFTFAYTQKVLKDSKRITLETQNNLRSVLEEIARTSHYNFKRVNQRIYVIPSSKPQQATVTEEIVMAHDITGQVLDAETGDPLPGANVIVKGRTIGTVTDADGRFKLSVPDDAEVIIVSFIGFEIAEVSIAQQSSVVVNLKASAHALEDIVVVGYGTQNKEDITGAVTKVNSEMLESRPTTSLAQSLQGLVPNLNITFSDATPGAGATFNIRGTTSINGGEPLILIDGIPGDPTLINPRDIESVTVLKDAASAAVYGARGAYGVILINTKTPRKQAPIITYNGNVSFSTPTILPETITDPYEGLMMQNDAGFAWDGTRVSAATLEYAKLRSENPSLPAAKVVSTSSGDRYIYAANTDWIGELYKKVQPVQQHNLSLSGGSDKVSYYLSGGYLKQSGVLNYDADQYKRYNLRAKVDVNVAKWLTINDNLMFNRGVKDFPSFWGGNSTTLWQQIAVDGLPNIPVKNPDGSWTNTGRYVGFLADGGRTVQNENFLQNTIGVELNFFEDKLKFVGKYTFQNDGYHRTERYKPLDNISSIPGSYTTYGTNSIKEVNTDNYYNVINAYAAYEDQIGDHSLKGTVGFNQELRQYSGNTVQRENLISDELSNIGLAIGDITVTGSGYEWAVRGIFYRLNYTFKDKYLLELNGRYDGSSRFPKSDRFGFFPSASAGWRVSKEPFFSPLTEVVSNLKLRGSYGSLGNQNLGSNYYPYIATMSTSTSALILNGAQPLTISAPGTVSGSLTWENATTYDAGVDMGLLNDKLSLSFDWYIRDTKDMLTKSKSLPAVYGTNEPLENAADLRTKGWELSLGWNDRVNIAGSPLSYDIRGVLSDYTSKIMRYDNPNKTLTDYYEGQRFGEIWGFETEGFFQSKEEIANHANQSIMMRQPNDIRPGDLKFADRNGDGVVNFGESTAENPGDRFVIGNRLPRYSYGFSSSFSWKGISLSFIFQGIGKRDFYAGADASYLWSVYNRPYNTPMKHIQDNYWTPENPDAYFPRLKGYIALSANKELEVEQTRYLQDASYLRLKNLTVGYTFQNSLIEKAHLRNVRLYFSGENMWEKTHMFMPIDPEAVNGTSGRGDGYPFVRSYSIGLDISL